MTHLSPASRAPRLASIKPPEVSRIAFLSSARAENEAGETVLVHSLCWPTVPSAWIELTQALQAVWTGRGKPSPNIPGIDKPPSWLGTCAPQLSAPFRGAVGAEESSIAALVSRTPMQAAVAIIDSRAVRVTDGAQQQALFQCLSAYDKFVRTPMRVPCTMLVSRSQSEVLDKQFLDELARCRTLMPSAPWLGDVRLQFWNEAMEPLALEMSRVVAAATARHALFDSGNDALFEAIATKLAHNPLQRGRSVRKRRA
jgi:hypothetical protein